MPSQDQPFDSSVDLAGKLPASTHHHRISLSVSSHQQTSKQAEASSRPTCSRRLFDQESHHQISAGDILPTTKAMAVSSHSSVYCPSNVPSHRSSTIDSSCQNSTALNQTRATSPLSEDNLLSVAVSDLSGSVITPVKVLRAIWRKAFELLNDPKSVSLAPGQGDSARIVKSYSGSRPHLVSRKKTWAVCL